jgi:Phosphoesterase family
VGADDHGRVGLPGRRPDRDHLRRGQRLRRLLRRGIGFSPDHPNVPLPGKNGPGGGGIGAVLLSPLIKPGTVSTMDYNHYSLLRTVEDIFGLPHLGDAAMPQVRSFGPDVFG